MAKKLLRLWLITFCIVGILSPAYGQGEYRLGPEDEIEIRVWNHDDLTRKVRVGLNGHISFPFVGEIKAQGLTVHELQKGLEDRLGPRFIINPHVSIVVNEFKSQKFFVVGNVQKPGTFPLTKPVRVVEAISLAGGVLSGGASKQSSGGVAIIVRAQPGEKANLPQLPDKTPAGQKITVSLPAAMAGDTSQNLEIKNGDTIFVPQLVYYVTGEVKRAGRYPYEENMTVLMAVTTAEGFSDKASRRGTYIIREQSGNKEKVKVNMDDLIRPGDTIVVPESWF
jgi:polysaccharide biosynthesis/export protein